MKSLNAQLILYVTLTSLAVTLVGLTLSYRYAWLVLVMTALVGLSSGATLFIMERLVISRLRLLEQGMHQAKAGNLAYLAETQRQASEARLARMLEVAADAIIIIDEAQRIIIFNRGAEAVFGYPAHEVTGRPLDMLLPLSTRQTHSQHIQDFARTDRSQWRMGTHRPDITGRHKDGHEFPIEVSIAKLIQDGQVTFTAIVRDITQHKRAEQALLLQHYLAMALSSTNDIQTALTYLLETTLQLEGIDGGAIRLLNPETDQLRLVTCQGFDSQLITGTAPLNIETVGATATANEQPTSSYYFELTPRLNNQNQTETLPKMIVVPIAFGGQVIASLILGTFSTAMIPTSTHNTLQTIAILASDVIARINAEAALRASQERLNSIMQSLDDLIWSAHPATLNTTYLSQAAEKIYGRPGAEFIANPNLWFEVIHPDDQPYVVNKNAVLPKLNRINLEYRIVQPNGTIRWLNDRTWVIRDESGAAVRVDGIATDITERKRAEEELRQSEARNRAILDAIPDLLFQFNRQGVILGFKAKEEKDLYIPASQLIGSHLSDNLPPQVAQLTIAHINQALDTGQIQQFQYQLLMPDGLVHTYEARLVVTGPDETLAIIRNISEQARLEQMKSDFINRASHELRTPLTTIMMMVELIREGGEPAEVAEFWHILQVELNRQRNLVEDLLTVGRLESGTLALKPEPLDLSLLLPAATLAVTPLANAKQIELDTSELPPYLPPINGDQNGLKQVFINLLNNAVKFTPNGGKVCLRATSDNNGVTVWVSDTGMGIPPADLPHLFERFFRASNATYYEIPGSGVGLYIVKSIVEGLHGHISLDSVLNQGTTFTIWLPVSQAFN